MVNGRCHSYNSLGDLLIHNMTAILQQSPHDVFISYFVVKHKYISLFTFLQPLTAAITYSYILYFLTISLLTYLYFHHPPEYYGLSSPEGYRHREAALQLSASLHELCDGWENLIIHFVFQMPRDQMEKKARANIEEKPTFQCTLYSVRERHYTEFL